MTLEYKALNAITMPNNNYNIWYLDCGATEHMTPYLNKMKNYKKILLRIHMANKEKILADGKGDVTVKFSDKNGGLLADLADVLFVPSLGANLLSVGRLVERGLKIRFENNEARISKLNGEVILIAFRKNRLYEIEEQAQITTSMNGDISLWHRRFGHYDSESMKQVVKKNTLRNVNCEGCCNVCTLGTVRSSPFRHSFRVSTTRPLELIHSDLVGPIEPTSQGGSKYFVSFIDDYSRYTMVFPMKSNTEALLKFDEFRRISENALDVRIQTIKTGNGSEYMNPDFERYLANHSIKRHYSGLPDRNSVARNMNQKLLNMARCMIKESGIPENLWADALVSSCYVINKCSSIAVHGQIPEELWTGESVHTQHLRVFGCRAWITLNPGMTFENLDFDAIECVFLGYSKDINSYKLWERKRNVFFITEDVKFDENIFPCKTELSEEEMPVNEQKSNIMTIKLGNEANERPEICSNTNMDKTNCQTEEVKNEYEITRTKNIEYKHEAINEKPQASETEYESETEPQNAQSEATDETPTIEEVKEVSQSTSTLGSKNARKPRRRRFIFRSKYFVKRRVFPLSNSKQKLIKSYRTI